MLLPRCFLLLALGPLAAFPQAQSNSGDLGGSVLDQSGGAISKARLQLSDPDRAINREAQSNTQGEFRFPVVPPGRYRLKVEADGFNTKLIDGVEVRVGDSVSLKVQMAVGAIQQQIEVQADAPVVDAERIQQATTIGLGRIRDLPINRRNYLDFALLS